MDIEVAANERGRQNTSSSSWLDFFRVIWWSWCRGKKISHS